MIDALNYRATLRLSVCAVLILALLGDADGLKAGRPSLMGANVERVWSAAGPLMLAGVALATEETNESAAADSLWTLSLNSQAKFGKPNWFRLRLATGTIAVFSPPRHPSLPRPPPIPWHLRG